MMHYTSEVRSAYAALLLAAALFKPPSVGQQAPHFTLIDQNGKTIRLSAAHGHKVVLVFYRGYW